MGYPRLISMENFRTPNFELMAEIMDWLLHRFEPNCAIPDDLSTEAHRVQFIKVLCEKVVLRTGVKLNARKLYASDGYAVKELLRLAQVLYDAQRSVGTVPVEAAGDDFALTSKLADLKSTRSLCSQIVETGATVYELLQKEAANSEDRDKALRFLDGMSRNLGGNTESEAVERAISTLLGNHSANLEQLKTMLDELQRDEKGLEQKIRKKKQELDRGRKRLGSLASVRPAFMDEYEQLEQELERYYEQYVGRFRNLDYLEYEIDVLNREEKERMEENDRALKRMQKRLRDEEWRLLRGEEDALHKGKGKKIKAQKKSWMPPATGLKVEGGMDGNGEHDDESSEEASDSDPPISIGASEESGDDGHQAAGWGAAGRSQAAVGRAPSVGGSVSDDDILNESDDDEEMSDDGGGQGNSPPVRPSRKDDDFDF